MTKKKAKSSWGVKIDGIEVLRDPDEVCARLQKDKTIGFDTETTGLSPWRDNIALVQLYGEQTGTLAVIQVRDGELHPALKGLLQSDKKFVVHNGVGFDLLFLAQAGVAWRKASWHDTLVGETLLASTGRRDVSKSLRESLRRRLGQTIDKDIEHGHWGSDKLTDRQIEYAAQDVISLPALYRSQLAKATETDQAEAMAMEQDLMPIVAQMSINGLPLPRKRLVEYIKQQRTDIAAAERRLRRKLGKTINLQSTQQLKAALARVGIEVDSTSKETLIPISQFGGKAGAVIDDLLLWKHGNQRIKMYNDAWMENYIIGDWVHPHYWQCSADTTRFTCSNPNLQQVPKDGRSIIGGIDGMKVVSCDYSQIEVRLAGYIAGDTKLLKLLEAGDVHTAVASAVFRKAEKSITPRERKLAKAMVFLLLFGGGAAGFHDYVNLSGGEITLQEATDYVQRFFTTFGGLRALRERAEYLSHKPGPVFVRLPNGARRILVGYNKKSTTILNTMVQGSAAVGLKYGLLEADRRGLTKYIGGTVHDEIVGAVPNKEVKAWSNELKEAMIVGMSKVLKATVKAELKIGEVWQP